MKKKQIVLILSVVVLIVGTLFIKEYTSPKNKTLPRDSDKEFYQGSKIAKQDLSSNQVEALYKLCKVWGYVKYYHPDVISGKLNWDAELFRVMPNILKATSSDEVNAVLLEWLEDFPVNVDTGKTTEESKRWIKIQKEFGKKEANISWIQDVDFLGQGLSKYLCGISNLCISDRKNSYASFDKIGTVSFENEKMYHASDGDMGMYLLGLFRFWNIYEYYSPNVEITTEDWESVLKNAIPIVANAKDYRSYAKAIAQVVSKTGDAHSLVVDQDKYLYYYYGNNFLPCDIKIIDGQIVVTQVKPSEKQLRTGDILLTIDGTSLQDRIEEQKNYHALPEDGKMLNQLKHLLLQTKNDKAEVRIQRGIEKKTLQIPTQNVQYSYKNPIPNGVMDSLNIGYIDPSALEHGDLENLMKEFQETDGLIVDLRYYPSIVITYLLNEYINPTQKVFANLGIPNQALPGAFFTKEMVSGKGTMKEQENDIHTFSKYSGKVVLLMDEGTQSQSEFAIMSFRQAPNAIVVGNPSIGANGNVSVVKLPGEIVFGISGLGVYTPNGAQTQRCGLSPDVECYQTIEGILSGKDELIEKAVELIQE